MIIVASNTPFLLPPVIERLVPSDIFLTDAVEPLLVKNLVLLL